MFDFKKTMILTLVVLAVVMTAIAGYCVGNKVGYNKGKYDEQYSQFDKLIRQDSLLRKQTEQTHMLIDRLYTDKFNSQ